MAQQQLEVVGTVVEIKGNVHGTIDAQSVRTLAEGQPVYAGEHLQTGADGQIVISLQNGIRFDMGRNDEAVLDEEVYGSDTDALRAEAVATRDEIQAAIARGEDPAEVGEAPAAGEDAAGLGDAPGAEVVVARTGRFGEVQAGFETGARAPAGIQVVLEEDGQEIGGEEAQGPLTNDAPVTSSNAITVDQTDQDTGLGLSAPTDVDGDALTIMVTGLPTQGQVTLADGTPIVNGQTLTAAELAGLQYDGPGAAYDGSDVGDFTYTVDDGSNPPVAGSVDITVNAINDAPVTSSNAITVDETDQDTGLGLSAPTDVDGDALTITVTGLPTQGQVTLADGTPIVNGQTLTAAELAGLQYDGPGAAYDGADVGDFTYTVDDGSNPPVAGSVDITVNAINDAPVTSSNAITVDETDQDTGLGLSAPTDVDGDALTIMVTGLPNQGQVTLADGTPIVNGQTLTAAELAGLQYDGPGAAYDGADVGDFTYTVDDGSNPPVAGSVDITVNAINDAPVTSSNAITVDETDQDTGLGLSAPTDVDGDALTITVTGLPTQGQITLADGTPIVNGQTLTAAELAGLQYDGPGAAYDGSDVGDFTYTVDDGSNPPVAGSVDITVNAINDAPVTSSNAITVDETDQDTGLGLSAPTDVDGDALTITVTGLPTQGQITLADGTPIVNGQTLTAAELAGLQYDGPGAAYDGSDVGDFTYTVDDGSNPPVAGSVDITVNAINDAPLLLSEGNSLAFTELARSMSGVDWSSLGTGSSADANGIHNANLTTVDSGSTLRITYVDENAGYSNTLGYYLVDQDTGTFSSGAVVFADTNSVSTPVHEIDIPAGQTVGFFLIANGANRYGAQVSAVQGGSATFEMIDNAGTPALTYIQGGTSQVLTEVYHSYDSALNPDGFVRVASGLTDPAGDSLRIGFEDLPAARSDWDLRDLTIDVELVDTYLNGETLLPTLQVSDPDSAIVGANVNLSSAHSGDTLAFDVGGDVSLVGGDVFILGTDSGVDAVFDPAGDQLTLSGDATAATYEQILQAVAIDNAAPTDQVARTVQVDVSDGTATTTLTTHLGTSLAETLSGGSGADVLNGAGGADNLLGGAGDDILVHDAIDAVVDGGSGSDTLIIDGVSVGLTNALDIERLDMQDLSGGDQLSLSLADVLNITDANDILFVDGDSGDQVTINSGDGWVEQSLSPGDAGFRNGYTLYESGAAKIYIEDQISVDLI